jgi:hypothetical protein
MPLLIPTGPTLAITVVLAVAILQPNALAVTVYTPALIACAFVIEGLCVVEVKLFGPVQLYVVDAELLPKGVAIKLSEVPAVTGELMLPQCL